MEPIISADMDVETASVSSEASVELRYEDVVVDSEFLHAEKVAQIAGKSWSRFFARKTTREFLESLSHSVPHREWARRDMSGFPVADRTLIAPELALYFAFTSGKSTFLQILRWVAQMHGERDLLASEE
jgi:hypothetical protein